MVSLDAEAYGKNFVYTLGSLIAVVFWGICFAVTYFMFASVQTTLKTINCTITTTSAYSNCQEWFTATIYPMFDIILPTIIYLNYLVTFSIILGLMYMGYQTRNHPAFLVLHIITSILFGYAAILLSNMYSILLDNALFLSVMTPFPFFHFIMTNYPQIMFFSILISGSLGFMGIFGGRLNTPQGIS